MWKCWLSQSWNQAIWSYTRLWTLFSTFSACIGQVLLESLFLSISGLYDGQFSSPAGVQLNTRPYYERFSEKKKDAACVGPRPATAPVCFVSGCSLGDRSPCHGWFGVYRKQQQEHGLAWVCNWVWANSTGTKFALQQPISKFWSSQVSEAERRKGEPPPCPNSSGVPISPWWSSHNNSRDPRDSSRVIGFQTFSISWRCWRHLCIWTVVVRWYKADNFWKCRSNAPKRLRNACLARFRGDRTPLTNWSGGPVMTIPSDFMKLSKVNEIQMLLSLTVRKQKIKVYEKWRYRACYLIILLGSL